MNPAVRDVVLLGEQSINPVGLSGLRRYYNAKTLALSEGAAVASWPDLGPVGNNAAQGTGSLQPIYSSTSANGYPGITFDGSDDTLVFTSDATIKTIIAVCKYTNPPAQSYAPLLGDPTAAPLAGSINTQPWMVDGHDFPGSFPACPVRVNGTDSGYIHMQVRYTSLSVIAIRWPVGQTATFGYISRDRVSNRNFKGVYAALAVFDRVLTDGEVAGVERYFAREFAIALRSRPTAYGRGSGIFIGDSLTLGQGSTGGSTYPAQAANTLVSSPLGVDNLGVSGTTTADWLNTYFSQNLNATYYKVNRQIAQVAHVWLGTNDLSTGVTPATTYANLKIIWGMCRALGMKVVASTILSRSNAGTPAGFNTDRAPLNGLIRGDTSQYDYLADVATDVNIGFDGAETNTVYFNADLCHMTNAGYGVVSTYHSAAYAALGLT